MNKRSSKYYWDHREASIAHTLDVRAKKVAEGKCAICPNKREQLDKVRCDACLEKARNAQKQIRVNRALLGECATNSCFGIPVSGKIRCEKCLAKQRRAKRNAKSRNKNISST